MENAAAATHGSRAREAEPPSWPLARSSRSCSAARELRLSAAGMQPFRSGGCRCAGVRRLESQQELRAPVEALDGVDAPVQVDAPPVARRLVQPVHVLRDEASADVAAPLEVGERKMRRVGRGAREVRPRD